MSGSRTTIPSTPPMPRRRSTSKWSPSRKKTRRISRPTGATRAPLSLPPVVADAVRVRLSRDQRIRCRDRVVQAARLTLANKDHTHYTEGPLRWDGIKNRRNAEIGQFAEYSD